MKTILTPVDFSSATRGVIDAASSLAQSLGARIVLLHSLQPPMITTDYGVGVDVLQQTVAIGEKATEQQLKHLVGILEARGLAVLSLRTIGPAAPNIVAQAKKTRADYIVLGSHGHTAFYDLIVGSTTHAVLKKAPCPVIVVPPKATKPAKQK